MTAQEERDWWLQMVSDLRDQFTIDYLAEELGVSQRTICNWQNGERPMGMKAVRVYLLHVKHCSAVHRNTLRSATGSGGAE